MNRDTKERASNLELLRIICILMVLTLHYLNRDMGGALRNTIKGTSNYYIIYFIESLCIIAVNCFVIISGYFMINKHSIRLQKPINLIFISIFYGGALYIVSVILGIRTFNSGDFATSLIFVYGSKWFVGSYVALFLLSPFFNKVVIGLNKNNYKLLIVILIILFSLIPMMFPEVSYNDNGYGVLNFITLYFIGGYLKLHHKINKRKIYYLIMYLICTLITTVGALGNPKVNVWWGYNSIINVISSISLFMFFLRCNIKSTIINYLSTFSFAVYIIHSDSSIRVFLYRNIFKSDKYWNNPQILINMSKAIIGIYVGCILIEILRRILFRPISKKIKLGHEIEVIANIAKDSEEESVICMENYCD